MENPKEKYALRELWKRLDLAATTAPPRRTHCSHEFETSLGPRSSVKTPWSGWWWWSWSWWRRSWFWWAIHYHDYNFHGYFHFYSKVTSVNRSFNFWRRKLIEFNFFGFGPKTIMEGFIDAGSFSPWNFATVTSVRESPRKSQQTLYRRLGMPSQVYGSHHEGL